MKILLCHCPPDAALLAPTLAVSTPERVEKALRLPKLSWQLPSLGAGLLAQKLETEFPNGYVSLSHSGAYAAAAASNRPIGVDVQKILSMRPRTIERMATPHEREWLKTTENLERSAILLWSLKEAYLKASGCDTHIAFTTGFRIEEGERVIAPDGWHCEIDLRLPGYVVAVCEQAETPAAQQ